MIHKPQWRGRSQGHCSIWPGTVPQATAESSQVTSLHPNVYGLNFEKCGVRKAGTSWIPMWSSTFVCVFGHGIETSWRSSSGKALLASSTSITETYLASFSLPTFSNALKPLLTLPVTEHIKIQVCCRLSSTIPNDLDLLLEYFISAGDTRRSIQESSPCTLENEFG
jgi:hypothetical protein